MLSGRKGFRERGRSLWNDSENRVHQGMRYNLGFQELRVSDMGNELIGISKLKRALHLCLAMLV